jgi:hypothetical protein
MWSFPFICCLWFIAGFLSAYYMLMEPQTLEEFAEQLRFLAAHLWSRLVVRQ